MGKMSKALEENKWTIKRLLSEFNSYWKFVCTEKIMIRTKRTHLLYLSTSVTVFSVAEKLLSLYDFEIFRLSVYFY